MSDQVFALLLAIGLFLMMAAWIPLLELLFSLNRKLHESRQRDRKTLNAPR